MTRSFTPFNTNDQALAAHFEELHRWVTAASDGDFPASHWLDDAALPVLELQQRNAVGAGIVLRILNAAGGNLFTVDKNGLTGTAITNLGQFVNAKSFGAVGDGVADDTAAAIAAVGSLAGTGGTVFFPPGLYLFATPFNVTAPYVRILGAGTGAGGTTFRQKSASAQNRLLYLNASGVTVENIKLDGNRGSGGGGVSQALIEIANNVSDHRILNCEICFSNFCGIQIGATGTGRVSIFGNYIHDNGPTASTFGAGIYAGSAVAGPTDVQIIGNRIEKNYGLTGTAQGQALFASATRLRFIGNDVVNNYNAGGMVVDNWNGHDSQWAVVGNTFRVSGDPGPGTSGIELTGLLHAVLGNQFYWDSANSGGVVIEPVGALNAGNAVIGLNVFRTLSQAVILQNSGGAGTPRGVIVAANITPGCTTGVNVGTASANVIVALNDFEDGVTTPINDASNIAVRLGNRPASTRPNVTGSRATDTWRTNLMGALVTAGVVQDGSSA